MLQSFFYTRRCIDIKQDFLINEQINADVVEVIGETKMMVTVFNCNENIDIDPIDDFENEINEDFLNDPNFCK